MSSQDDKTGLGPGPVPPRRVDKRAVRGNSGGSPAAATAAGIAGLFDTNRFPPPSTTKPSTEDLASLAHLTLDQVVPFDKNPRQKPNPRWQEIYDSIKSIGLQQRLVVARRNGQYVLARGGRTRYEILQALWNETHDRRFFEMDFEVVDYTSDAEMLASHISENTNRGDMCFWDSAVAMLRLKDEIDQSRRMQLPIKETCDEIRKMGLPGVSESLMGIYASAVRSLTSLGPLTDELTTRVANTLLPKYKSYSKLASILSIPDFQDSIWNPALQAFGKAWADRKQESPAAQPAPADPDPDAPPSLEQVAQEDETENHPLPAPEAQKESEDTPDWPALLANVEWALAQAADVRPEAIPEMLSVSKVCKDASRDELLAIGRAPAVPPATYYAQEAPPVASVDTSAPNDASFESYTGEEEQTAGEHVTEVPATLRKRTSPQVYTAVKQESSAEETEDRPSTDAITAHEARRRAMREAGVSTQQLNSYSSEATLAEVASVPASTAAAETPTARRKRALFFSAMELAAASPTLTNMVIPWPNTPTGWIVDIPPAVLAGTPIPTAAKQVWWALANASLQIHVATRQSNLFEESRFGLFLRELPLELPEQRAHWKLVCPIHDNGSPDDYLWSWLIDPAHAELRQIVLRLTENVAALIANDPLLFEGLEHALDFQDLQEAFQTQRLQNEQKILEYFVAQEATPELIRRFFPNIDTSAAPSRPGRKPDVLAADIPAAQQLGLYQLWHSLAGEYPAERDRLVAIHQLNQNVNLTALFYAVTNQ